VFTSPFWIPNAPLGRLATSSQPAPHEWLYDDLAAWKDDGADIVVSLLSDREVRSIGLDKEAEYCRELGIEFHRFPITDRGVPDSPDAFLELINQLHDASKQNRNIVAHCYAGIGRSTLVAASLLVRARIALDDALTQISGARGESVPDTLDQRIWLRSIEILLRKPR